MSTIICKVMTFTYLSLAKVHIPLFLDLKSGHCRDSSNSTCTKKGTLGPKFPFHFLSLQLAPSFTPSARNKFEFILQSFCTPPTPSLSIFVKVRNCFQLPDGNRWKSQWFQQGKIHLSHTTWDCGQPRLVHWVHHVLRTLNSCLSSLPCFSQGSHL